jgi:hypothetical protein
LIPLMRDLAIFLVLRLFVAIAAALGGPPKLIRFLDGSLMLSVFIWTIALIAAAFINTFFISSFFVSSWHSGNRQVDVLRYRRSLLLVLCWALTSWHLFQRSETAVKAECVGAFAICLWISVMKPRIARPVSSESMVRSAALWLVCIASIPLFPSASLCTVLAGVRVRGTLGTTPSISSMRRLNGLLGRLTSNGVKLNPLELRSLERTILTFTKDKNKEMVDAAWEAGITGAYYYCALNVPNVKLNDFVKNVNPGQQPRFNRLGEVEWDVLAAAGRATPLTAFADPLTGHGISAAGTLLVTHARGPGLIVLDGLALRNVVFDRVPILYNGGSLMLDNVSFPHCYISVKRADQGMRFLSALVGEERLTFIANQ